MAGFVWSGGADFVFEEAPTDLVGHGHNVLTQQIKGDTNWRVVWGESRIAVPPCQQALNLQREQEVSSLQKASSPGTEVRGQNRDRICSSL